MQRLRVLPLGQDRIEFDGQQRLTRLLAPKQQALACVLVWSGTTVTRKRLAPLLWSELDEVAACANLRGALLPHSGAAFPTC